MYVWRDCKAKKITTVVQTVIVLSNLEKTYGHLEVYGTFKSLILCQRIKISRLFFFSLAANVDSAQKNVDENKVNGVTISLSDNLRRTF